MNIQETRSRRFFQEWEIIFQGREIGVFSCPGIIFPYALLRISQSGLRSPERDSNLRPSEFNLLSKGAEKESNLEPRTKGNEGFEPETFFALP